MNSGKYDRLKGQAVLALLTERTHRQAARKTGIGAATLSRWRRQHDFQQMLEAAQARLLEEGVSAVAKASARRCRIRTAVSTSMQVLDGAKGGD
jgi:transposase-like protein